MTASSFVLWLRWTLAMTIAWPLGFLATELSRFAKDQMLLPEAVPLIPVFLVWGALTFVLGGLVMWLPNALVLRGRLSLRPWFIVAGLCLIAAIIELAIRTIVVFLLPQISDVFTIGPDARRSSGSLLVANHNLFFELGLTGYLISGIAYWAIYRLPWYWGIAVVTGVWLANIVAIGSSMFALIVQLNAGVDDYGKYLGMFIVGGLVFGIVTGLAVMLMEARRSLPRRSSTPETGIDCA